MSDALDITRQWLSEWVIGLNLCPFARYPFDKGQVRLSVSDASDDDGVFRFVLDELDRLYRADPVEIETSVVIIENALADFDAYLDMLELLQDILPQTGLEGVIQIASFHPDYCFEGVDADDVTNYTNRSPYPLFHLIREESLERAIENYPDPEQIPENNMQLMREMGIGQVKALLAKIRSV
jgi:hypothetical protein